MKLKMQYFTSYSYMVAVWDEVLTRVRKLLTVVGCVFLPGVKTTIFSDEREFISLMKN